MAKKEHKKFVKLGPLAGGFADPYSRFKIMRDEVKELDTPQARRSGKIKAAIRGGHLVVVTPKEHEEYLESLGGPKKEEVVEPTLRDTLGEKTKAGLTEYYKEKYEVTDEEVEAFEKLKHDDMVEELVSLEEDND